MKITRKQARRNEWEKLYNEFNKKYENIEKKEYLQWAHNHYCFSINALEKMYKKNNYIKRNGFNDYKL